MFGIKNGNRFMSAVKRGASGVREAYQKKKKAAVERASRRLKDAKTKMENVAIEADLELETLKLEREMYEALAAVEKEKKAVAKAKKDAGVVGARERAKGLARSAGRAGGRFFRGLVTEPKRKRKTKSKR